MKLYLVRHAQTVDAAAGISQSPDCHLSSEGCRQARFLARRFKSIPLDLIISSTFTRTRETAAEILKYNPAPIKYSDLFTEVKKPSEAIGLDSDSEIYRNIRQLQKANQNDPNWHYSNEENFHDFKIRVLAAKKFIESRPEDNILTVTHGFWIGMLASLMLYGSDLTPSDHTRFRNFVHMSNTGISIFEYLDNTWKLVSWNDTTHRK